MKLKEKTGGLCSKFIPYIDARFEILSTKQCVKVADDYAIEFAEWISKLQFKEYSNGWGRMWDNGLYNTQQLLEIFKKEKGL